MRMARRVNAPGPGPRNRYRRVNRVRLSTPVKRHHDAPPAHAHAHSRQPAQQSQLAVPQSFLDIKRLSLHRPVPEQVDSSATSAFPRRRMHCTCISASSTGSKVASPCAYDPSEGESTGSSSAKTERTTQRPAESPPPPQPPAPALQVSDSGISGVSDDDGDAISLDRHHDSDEETLYLPDTLDEILEVMDLPKFEPESSATTKVSQSDCEDAGEERAYFAPGIYDHCTHASLLLQKAEAYEWKDHRRGNIFETPKHTNPTPAPPLR